MTVSSRRPRWFRRHPRLALSLFLLIATLVADVVLGSTLHALGFTLPGSRPDASFRTSDDLYHHSLKPNVSCTGQWGPVRYQINTDSLGFKSGAVQETPLAALAGRRRALIIGDSFTEGIGIEYPDTFAGIANEMLTAGGHGTEVLNAGVASYSPIIYWRKVEHLIGTVGLKVDRVVVFLDLSDMRDESIWYSMNDAGQVTFSKDNQIDTIVKRFIEEHTVLIGSCRGLIRRIRQLLDDEPPKQRAENDWRCSWTYLESTWQEYGEKGLTRATIHMDKIAAFLQQRAIPLTVFVYPWPDQVRERTLEDRQVTHWRAWAAKRGAGFVDCYPAFIHDEPGAQVIERCFLWGDVHWTRAGHEVIAKKLVSELIKK